MYVPCGSSQSLVWNELEFKDLNKSVQVPSFNQTVANSVKTQIILQVVILVRQKLLIILSGVVAEWK